MRRVFVAMSLMVVVLTVASVACSKGSATPTAVPSPVATAVPTATSATSGSTATPVASPTTATVTPVPFFLNVTDPQDETTVNTSTVDVKGSTTPDAVVSVNGQSVDVDASGNFSTTVTLQPGPNSISVVASDFAGDSQSKVINIIYVQ